MPEAANTMAPWIELMLQGGAFGVVAWLVIHLFRVAFPRMIAAHQAERTEMLASHRAERMEMMAECRDSREKFLAALDRREQEHVADRRAWRQALGQACAYGKPPPPDAPPAPNPENPRHG